MPVVDVEHALIKEVRRNAVDVAASEVSPRKALEEMRFFHVEFTLVDLIFRGASQEFLQTMFRLMDSVDDGRNALLKIMNDLFERAGLGVLPMITKSTEQLRLSAEVLRENDWSNFYLREHRILRPFLEGGIEALPQQIRERIKGSK
jgi:hypothetical protein